MKNSSRPIPKQACRRYFGCALRRAVRRGIRASSPARKIHFI
jgi:hypothetical protein